MFQNVCYIVIFFSDDKVVSLLLSITALVDSDDFVVLHFDVFLHLPLDVFGFVRSLFT